MMIVTIGLTLAFRKSDNLAAAYGIAVSATMLMTSVLLYMAMRQYLRWSLPLSAAVAGGFLIVDSAFFLSNAAKIAEGGYVPLALAVLVYGVMWLWHSGRAAVTKEITEEHIPVEDFMAGLEKKGVPRVPGTAVFLTRSLTGVPPVMAWHVHHNRALHERVMVLNVTIEPVPWVRNEDRLRFAQEAPNFWRATAHFGFMERPDIPATLREAEEKGCSISLEDVTYYIGHETVMVFRYGKSAFSPPWTGTRPRSPISSSFPATMWLKSAARSRFRLPL